MNIPELDELNKSTCREYSIKLYYPEFWVYINTRYPTDLKWAEKLYWYYHNLTTTPKCETCGRPVKFNGISKGYSKYCSYKCSNGGENKKSLTAKTCLERYGVSNPMQNEAIRDKLKQTNLKKYGVENPMQSEVVKKKVKQTSLEKYGVEHPSQNEVIKDKLKQTNLKKYGVMYNSQSPEVKNKKRQTCIEKYGVENPSQSDVIKEKVKQTNLKLYGVEYYTQSDGYKLKQSEIRNKIKQTNLEKYGVEYYSQSDAFKATIKAQLPDIKQKTKQTNLEKYGVEYYSQSDAFKATIKAQLPDIKQKTYNTKKQNGTFNTSKIEIQFESWLKQNNINYIRQYRSPEYPFNCDFYFPDRDLYLEIQGHWSHGGHPFDPTNDIKTLNEWKSKGTKYYDNVIDVWTVRDPMKRKVAKENDLNWCEVFTDDLNVIIKQFKNLY